MVELSFKQQKDLIQFEKDCKMEALKYIRDTEKLKHEWELERTRIRTAEIRKAEMRRQQYRELGK